jgi:hypothetical protein
VIPARWPISPPRWAAYDPEVAGKWSREALDPGGRELATGLIGVHGLRDMIQLAIDILSANRPGGDDAFGTLCQQAAEPAVP